MLSRFKPKHLAFGTPLACLVLWLTMMYRLTDWASFGPQQMAFTITTLFVGFMVPILVIDQTYSANHWRSPNENSSDSEDDA